VGFAFFVVWGWVRARPLFFVAASANKYKYKPLLPKFIVGWIVGYSNKDIYYSMKTTFIGGQTVRATHLFSGASKKPTQTR